MDKIKKIMGEPNYKGYTLVDMHKVIGRKIKRADLRKMYKTLFGKTTAGTNGDWLRNKIAYELQRRLKYKNDEPDVVRKRREALGDEEPQKKKVEVENGETLNRDRDPRLPPVGTILERTYGDKLIKVRVNEDSFDLIDEDGTETWFRSISGVARDVCVCEVNGYVFFGLDSKRKGADG